MILTRSGLGKKHHLNQNKGKRKRSRRRGGERRRREEQEPLSPPLETVTLLLGAAVREQRHRHRPPPQCHQRSSPTSRAPLPPHQVHFSSPFISFGCLRFLPACRTNVLHAGGRGKIIPPWLVVQCWARPVLAQH
jgi:hypothetical protein